MQQKLSVEELCMKLKPVFGKRMDELYLKYAMAQSREEKEEIEHVLNALYRKHLSELLDKKVLLEPPSKEVMQGGYNLATISYADKKLHYFNLREQDWIRHFCISGMSGSGKTTLAFHIINNFIEKEKPFLIFDWKKSFRPLMLIDSEILCFTVGNEAVSNYFKINVSQPPQGVEAKEWINVLCDLITESFFASYGVHKILLETLDEAFKDFGVYNGSGNYPTWNEIKWRLETKLEKKKGREASWLMSALRIAHVLTFGNFGKALNYKGKESLSVEELLNKKIIFELNALGTVEKKFFCEFILTYIYKLKKARQKALNQNFDHAILVDEAHNIFLKDKTHFVKESVTDMIYREMREYGTALICLDQHISKISDTVAGNSACHVAFQQQLPQDIETISGLMQLKDRKQYFSMLPVGSAIVKLAERYTAPFLIEVSQVELRMKEVSDQDIKNRMKLIFEGRALEQGKDKEFGRALMRPTQPKLEQPEEIIEQETESETKMQEARAPDHALFSGEIEEFKKLDTTSREEDPGFKNLDKLEEVKEKLEVDDKREEKQEEEKVEEIPEESKIEVKEETDLEQLEPVEIIEELNDVQQILCEFVQKKLAAGWAMKQIERVLEENTIEGGYTIADVFQVINYVFKNDFKRDNLTDVTVKEKQKTYKEKNNLSIKGDEQEGFLAFLRENLEHDYSTIELYNKIGLSVRKGNKIKNKLLEMGMIKVEEHKNSKGWRKIIRLA